MLKSMHEKLIDTDKNEKIRYILVKSTGQRFFSAGYDLKDITGDPLQVFQIIEWGRKVNEYILLMKKPVITQVQGYMTHLLLEQVHS
jgi:enoyl-CoA hydratase/carnithine racemase